jgi:chromosome partitioning protein
VRIIAIVNQKGGSGKTTTAINLAAVLARRNHRVLLVDMDPQGHCAAGLGVPEHRIERSIADALLMNHSPATRQALKQSMLWEVARNLDLAPSSVSLAGLEAAGGGLHALKDRDRRLSSLLSLLEPDYDLCLVDCPPTIGLLTFNALRACGEALMPVETGYFALRGAERQWATIETLMKRLGREIVVHLLPTLYDIRSPLAGEILNTLRRRFASVVMPLVIHEHDALREAASFGQPIIEYAPNSPACADFERLADWLIERRPPVSRLNTDVYPAEGFDMLAASAAMCEVEVVPDGRVVPEPAGGRIAELARRVRRQGDRAATAAALAAPDLEPVQRLADSPMPLEPLVSSRPAPMRFGVIVTEQGVVFSQPGLVGRRLAIAGDFNGWSMAATPLDYLPGEDRHMATVQLPAGRYQYRLVVDEHWRIDPHNDYTWPNEFGEENNVFIVEPRHQPLF